MPPGGAPSSPPPFMRPSAKAVRISTAEAPKIDGDLSDPAWAKANIIDNFRQRSPNPYEPATERTVVREVAKYRGPYPYVDGLIMQVTQRIDSIEVLHLARAEGRSNYTIRRLISLWSNLATNFSVLPLRLAIFAGVAMGLLGFLAAVVVIIEALVTGTPSGWASTMTTTLLIAGVQFLILGVLGEYVGRAFLSANGKPQGVVREMIAPRSDRTSARQPEDVLQ